MTSSDTLKKDQSVLPLDWARQSGKVADVMSVLEGKLQKRRRKRRATKATIASVLVVALTALWAVPYVRDTNEVATAAAHRQTLALSDGSQAELNARTTLHTDFRYGRRIVQLSQGEAFFSVTKDPAHPFIVETPVGTVRVTGTKFNVRLKEGGAAEVTLLEGAVEMLPTATALAPGQQFDSSAGLRTLSPAELENTVSWRTGLLALDNLTLGEAVARFSSYHGKEIAVAPTVASLSLGGSCPLDDLPGFLSFLKEAFPINVLTQGDGSYRVVGK